MEKGKAQGMTWTTIAGAEGEVARGRTSQRGTLRVSAPARHDPFELEQLASCASADAGA